MWAGTSPTCSMLATKTSRLSRLAPRGEATTRDISQAEGHLDSPRRSGGYPAKFAGKSFDLVFTMAVLEHIHPTSVEVFDHMARIAERILTIEPSGFHISERQFPHEIRALFAGRGFKLESVTPMDHQPELGPYSAYSFKRA